MEKTQNLSNKNLKKLYDNVYLSYGPNGIKNLCQQKILPINIHTEDKEILKKIVTIFYSKNFDNINIYKSRIGYFLFCYKDGMSFKNQFSLLYSLEKYGVDISYIKELNKHQYQEPFDGNFFISRVSPKLENIYPSFFELFDSNTQKDLFQIISFLKFIRYNNHINKYDFFIKKMKEEQFEMKIFKNFFSYYEKSEMLKAFENIYNTIMLNPSVAVLKFLGSINNKTLPKYIQEIYSILDMETGSRKKNIQYLI